MNQHPYISIDIYCIGCNARPIYFSSRCLEKQTKAKYVRSLLMATEILNQQFDVLSDYLDKYVNDSYL